MNLPFTETAFFDVFGAYNRALWPAVVVLWALTAGVVVRWWRRGHGHQVLSALLAVHWAWSGVAYHWFFFPSINPAAALFAGFFVVEAALFMWLTVTSRTRFTVGRSLRGTLGGSLIAYGLIYPLLGLGFGPEYPRLPLFAVPCPTTLLTAGLLITAAGTPRFVNIVPVIWAAIGSSAALLLGVKADLALVVAGTLLALDTLAPHALGPRDVLA